MALLLCKTAFPKKINLERKKEGERERESVSIYWTDPPNGFTGKGWARLKLRTKNFILLLHVIGRNPQVFVTSSTASPGTLAGSWIREEHLGLKLVLDCKQRLNMLHCNARPENKNNPLK